MREYPRHAVTDVAVVRALIAENPWATIVSHGEVGLVASHYPVLLDEHSEELAVLSHVGRPDEQLHGFGDREMLLIVSGPHGYISPSWYSADATPVPTWNFSVAHCYGIPQILDPEENLCVLTRLVERFERHVEHPVAARSAARRAARHRDRRHPPADHALRVQDQDEPRTRTLRANGRSSRRSAAAVAYASRELAEAMQRALAGDP